MFTPWFITFDTFNFIVLFFDFIIYPDSFDLNVFEKREKKTSNFNGYFFGILNIFK